MNRKLFGNILLYTNMSISFEQHRIIHMYYIRVHTSQGGVHVQCVYIFYKLLRLEVYTCTCTCTCMFLSL